MDGWKARVWMILLGASLVSAPVLGSAAAGADQDAPTELSVEITWAAPAQVWLVEGSEGFSCDQPILENSLERPPTAYAYCWTEAPVTCQTAAVSLDAQVSTTGYRGTAICGQGAKTAWAGCSVEQGPPGLGLVFDPVEKACEAQTQGNADTSLFICLITPLEPCSDPGLVTQRCSWTLAG